MGSIKISDRFTPEADLVLYEGDTLDLLQTIPSGQIDLVITSPPYNLGKEYETRLHMDDYLSQQKRVITECERVVSDHGSICWQVGNFVQNGKIIPLDIVLYPIFAELGLQLRNRIIWQFGHGLHASRRFSGRYETILWFTKSDQYTFNLDAVRVPQKYPSKKHFKGPKKGELSGNPLGKNPSDIWDIPNVKANHVEKTIHPCQFPIELVERLVLALTNEYEWVLDPFMGVGSSAIAALIHNRKAIGAEIMHDYVEIARQRVLLAESGKLRVRPMNRPVYDPGGDISIPPIFIQLGHELQSRLFEPPTEYDEEEK